MNMSARRNAMSELAKFSRRPAPLREERAAARWCVAAGGVAGGVAPAGGVSVDVDAGGSASAPRPRPRPPPRPPRAAMTLPAGAFGSKKPSALGIVATSSMPFAACAASRKPAFSPTRGSFVVDVAGLSCAIPAIAKDVDKARTDNSLVAAGLISRAPSSRQACRSCGRFPSAGRRPRLTRMRRSSNPAPRRARRRVPSP